MDSLLNQYLLGLGEFSFDNYSKNRNTYLIWFFFVLATIITQINIFNVLIAIVSDSFARITQEKD
jgi:hypothetical protein